MAFTQKKKAQAEQLSVWDLSGGEEAHRLSVPIPVRQGHISVLDCSPDGRTLALGLPDGTAQLVDLTRKTEPRSIGSHVGNGPNAKGASAVCFSPDGRTLVTAGRDEVVRAWDLASGNEVRTFEKRSRSWIEALAFSGDGKWLATAGQSGVIRLWDTATGVDYCPTGGHRGWVWGMAVAPDGKTAATGGNDQTLRLWNLADGRELRRIEVDNWVAPCTFAADGKSLLVGVNDKLQQWDVATGAALALPEELAGFSGKLHGFAPNGQTLITSEKGVVTLRDWPTGRPRQRITLPSEPFKPEELVCTVASLSADGHVLITSSERHHTSIVGNFVQSNARFIATELWGTGTGKRLFRLEDAAWYAKHAFLPDGRFFVLTGSSGKEGGPVSVWDSATGRLQQQFAPSPREKQVVGAPPRSVRAFALAPNGKRLATAEAGGAILIYDVLTGQVLGELLGHRAELTCLAFSPDSLRLLTAGIDGTCLLWNVNTAVPGSSESRVTPAIDLAVLWSTLASADAAKAYQALWSLVAAPKESVPFLAEKLKPVPAVDEKHIGELIAALDSDKFAEREKATAELEKLGERTGPALEKLLKGNPSQEAKRRAEALAAKLGGPVTSPEQLRTLRAIEALEYIGTAEAVQVIEKLAAGAAGARETEDAKRTLARLKQRNKN